MSALTINGRVLSVGGLVISRAPSSAPNFADFNPVCTVTENFATGEKVAAVTLGLLPSDSVRAVVIGASGKRAVPLLLTTETQFITSRITALIDDDPLRIDIIPVDDTFGAGRPRRYFFEQEFINLPDTAVQVVQVPDVEPLIGGSGAFFNVGERIRVVTPAEWDAENTSITSGWYNANDGSGLIEVAAANNMMTAALVPVGSSAVVYYGQSPDDLPDAPVAFSAAITVNLRTGTPPAAPSGWTYDPVWVDELGAGTYTPVYDFPDLSPYDAFEWESQLVQTSTEKGTVVGNTVTLSFYAGGNVLRTAPTANASARWRRASDQLWSDFSLALPYDPPTPSGGDPVVSGTVPAKILHLRNLAASTASVFNGPLNQYQRSVAVHEATGRVYTFGDTQGMRRRNPHTKKYEHPLMHGVTNRMCLCGTVDPQDDQHVIGVFHSHFAADDQSNRHMLESFDGGDHWTETGANLTFLQATSCLKFPFETNWFAWSPSTPTTLYFVYQEITVNDPHNCVDLTKLGSVWIAKSTDSGATWTIQQAAIANTVFRAVRGVFVHPTSAETINIHGGNGIFTNGASGVGSFTRYASSPVGVCRSFVWKTATTGFAAFDGGTPGGGGAFRFSGSTWTNLRSNVATGGNGYTQIWEHLNRLWFGTGTNGATLLTAANAHTGTPTWQTCTATKVGHTLHTQTPGGKIGSVRGITATGEYLWQCQCFFLSDASSAVPGRDFRFNEPGTVGVAARSAVVNPRTGDIVVCYGDVAAWCLPAAGRASYTWFQAVVPFTADQYQVTFGANVSTRDTGYGWLVESGVNEGDFISCVGISAGTSIGYRHPEPANPLSPRAAGTEVFVPNCGGAVTYPAAGADPTDTDTIYVANDRSVNGGATFASMVAPTGSTGFSMRCFAAHGATAGLLYFWMQGNTTGVAWNLNQWRLYKSTNGATTAGNPVLVHSTIRLDGGPHAPPVAISPADDDVIFVSNDAMDVVRIDTSTGAITSLGVRAKYIAENGGAVPFQFEVTSIAVYHDNADYIAVGSNHNGSATLLTSEDGGDTWVSGHNEVLGEDQCTLTTGITSAVNQTDTLDPPAAAPVYQARFFCQLGAEVAEAVRVGAGVTFVRRGTSATSHGAGTTVRALDTAGKVSMMGITALAWDIGGNLLVFTQGNGQWCLKAPAGLTTLGTKDLLYNELPAV